MIITGELPKCNRQRPYYCMSNAPAFELYLQLVNDKASVFPFFKRWQSGIAVKPLYWRFLVTDLGCSYTHTKPHKNRVKHNLLRFWKDLRGNSAISASSKYNGWFFSGALPDSHPVTVHADNDVNRREPLPLFSVCPINVWQESLIRGEEGTFFQLSNFLGSIVCHCPLNK